MVFATHSPAAGNGEQAEEPSHGKDRQCWGPAASADTNAPDAGGVSFVAARDKAA